MNEGYRYGRRDGPRDRSLRVGDTEREAVGEELRRRHLEGRLETDELQARLERSIVAKTYAELDELITDFPPDTAERDRAAERTRRRPIGFAAPLLCVPLALIAAILVIGHVFWPAIPLLLFFVVRPLLWRRRSVWRV
jgi:Domain of unknown function (DUF1707)